MKKYLVSLLLLFLPLMALGQDMYMPSNIEQTQNIEHLLKLVQLFKTAIKTDVDLTQELHDKFWNELRGVGNENEIRKVIQLYKTRLVAVEEYNKEAWESAKLSYENNKVVETQRFIELENELPVQDKQSLFYNKDSNNDVTTMGAYSKQPNQSSDDAILLLEAAAAHKTLITTSGEKYDINEGIIYLVSMRLNSTFKRLAQLLDEKWADSNVA